MPILFEPRYILALTRAQYSKIANTGYCLFSSNEVGKYEGSPMIYYKGRGRWTGDTAKAKIFNAMGTLKQSARYAFRYQNFFYEVEYTIITVELNDLQSESRTINF